MRLVHLRLENFLPYVDLDLDLEGVGQIAVVGQNGSGKSSLLDAVLWCLYGQARARSDQLIREGATKALVETTWDAHGQEVRVTRSRDSEAEQTALYLHVDGQNRTRHTIADTQTAITELIGLSAPALLAGPVMVQGQSNALMAAAPSERKEILGQLFDLGRYEGYHERAREMVAAERLSAEGARAKAARMAEVVDEEFAVRSLRRDAEAEVTRARREVARVTAAQTALREKAISLRERTALAAQHQRTVDTRRTRITTAVVELARFDERLEVQRSYAALAVPAVEDIARYEDVATVQRDLANAERRTGILDEVPCGGAGVYASCAFLHDAMGLRDALPSLRAALVSLGGPLEDTVIAMARSTWQARSREAATVGARKAAAVEWLEVAAPQRERLEDGIAADRAEAQAAEGELRRLNLDQVAVAKIAEGLTTVTQDLDIAQRSLEAGLASAATAEARLRAVARAKEDLTALQEELREHDERVAVLSTLQRAFGRDGVPLLVLENGIPLIESRANEILGRMPGGFALALITQRETKAGTVRDTLEVLVSAEGTERSYALLSGGERLRVDFALRVALSDVLVRRSGHGWQTLWIDESFGSQDRHGREALLESIAAVTDDFGLVIVISHLEDVTDRFETRLVVSKDQDTGISTAEIVG